MPDTNLPRPLWLRRPRSLGHRVAIGYTLSITISVTLCLAVLLSSTLPLQPRLAAAVRAAAGGGLVSFFECAAYFAFAIQIATVTVLAPLDLETKTMSFGAYEALLAAVVSTMSLLPLTSSLCILSSMSIPTYHGDADRQPYRLWVFSATVAASLYPFFSSCIRYWAPSAVGEGAGEGGVTYITTDEWAAMTDVCFGDGLRPLSTKYAEGKALGAIHLTAALFVYPFAIAIVVPPVLRIVDVVFGNHGGLVRETIRTLCDRTARTCRRPAVMYALVVVPLGLAAALMWGFWTLRAMQAKLAAAVGGAYEGDEWGFGQVMAITVFAPVGAEILFVLYHHQWMDKPKAVALGDIAEPTQKKDRAVTSPL